MSPHTFGHPKFSRRLPQAVCVSCFIIHESRVQFPIWVMYVVDFPLKSLVVPWFQVPVRRLTWSVFFVTDWSERWCRSYCDINLKLFVGEKSRPLYCTCADTAPHDWSAFTWRMFFACTLYRIGWDEPGQVVSNLPCTLTLWAGTFGNPFEYSTASSVRCPVYG